ncbi:MAG: discoidin domain-containing protein, partial [Bifidobacteriaceae bacterium]|nr:discoidin domain-containing protein [Bifidobacteriaceae bacterium]
MLSSLAARLPRPTAKNLAVPLVAALIAGLAAITPATATPEPAPAGARNLALNRAVLHSSAKNYNETGHRATDGLYTEHIPGAPPTEPIYSAQDGTDIEAAFDGDAATAWNSAAIPSWIAAELPAPQTVASYKLVASGFEFPGWGVFTTNAPADWTFEGSDDGTTWVTLDQETAHTWASLTEVFQVDAPAQHKHYRVNATQVPPSWFGPATQVTLAEVGLMGAGGESYIPGAGDKPRWRSAAAGAQDLVVDLGAPSQIERVKLVWEPLDYATEYSIDVSADKAAWTTVYTNTAGDGFTDEFDVTATGQRYVRLALRNSSGAGYTLQEFEVWGANDFSLTAPDLPAALPDGTQYLTGGNWKLKRAAEVSATGEQLSVDNPGVDSAWLPAAVPGTALTSYLKAGAIVDPNFSDYQLQISDSFFTADWWYRDHFTVPASQDGKRTWLNFQAVNWKANVYFNGHRVGSAPAGHYDIEGAYTPAKFDVTEWVNHGGENFLAVFVKANETPGAVTLQDLVNAGGNGGALGADNPTIHASIGWDWVPTVRGRDVGIYEDVYLSYSQDVTIENPWVITDVDLDGRAASQAELTVKTELRNATAHGQNVAVTGVIEPGGIAISSHTLYVPPNSTVEALVDTVTIQNPELWWPNGYGEQPLYTATLTARTAPSVVSDVQSVKFGIREYSFERITQHDAAHAGLNIYVNGVRVVARGGNWGMSDANMAATPEDYDLKMRLHAEENLNIVRNWVGMTGHPAFYDAADKHGIMIMDDFWLANPVDGPNPNDEAMFLASAEAKIKRVRSHAALAFYCGRNEGAPPAAIDAALRTMTAQIDGTRHYVSDSAAPAEGMDGHGPYGVRDAVWYFDNTPAASSYNGNGNGAKNLSSERGQLNIPTAQSMHRMLGESIAWPPTAAGQPAANVWGMHDFTSGGATEAGVFLNHMENTYDPDWAAHGVEEFIETAQLMNYDNHKS